MNEGQITETRARRSRRRPGRLLGPEAQAALRGAAVFLGGFALADVEALAGGAAGARLDELLEASLERCVVINVDPDTTDRDPSILRAIAREHQACLGVYGTTFRPGQVRIGDRCCSAPEDQPSVPNEVASAVQCSAATGAARRSACRRWSH